jgi:hypothetical protein
MFVSTKQDYKDAPTILPFDVPQSHRPHEHVSANLFAKLKAALRKGAKRAVKELWRLIGKLVKSFVPDQSANYFRHAGYTR